VVECDEVNFLSLTDLGGARPHQGGRRRTADRRSARRRRGRAPRQADRGRRTDRHPRLAHLPHRHRQREPVRLPHPSASTTPTSSRRQRESSMPPGSSRRRRSPPTTVSTSDRRAVQADPSEGPAPRYRRRPSEVGRRRARPRSWSRRGRETGAGTPEAASRSSARSRCWTGRACGRCGGASDSLPVEVGARTAGAALPHRFRYRGEHLIGAGGAT